MDSGWLSRVRSPGVNASGRFLTYKVDMLAFRRHRGSIHLQTVDQTLAVGWDVVDVESRTF